MSTIHWHRWRWLAMLTCLFSASPAVAEELRYDNGEVRGSLVGLEPGQAEAMRLTTAHPARVTRLWLALTGPGPVEVHLWADNGGQQPDLLVDLAPAFSAEANSDGLIELVVDPPVPIGPERHFFVGHVVRQAGQPALLLDTSEAPICRALLWAYSPALGAETWLTVGEQIDQAFVCRHYLVRAEVEYHDQVLERSFSDQTEASGFGRPRRLAVVDFDLDGDPDVLQDGVRLLRNDGGRFEDISQAVGLAGIEGASGGVFADYDSDGDLDLFVFVDSCCDEQQAAGVRDRLLRNDSGVFVDVTDQAGLFDFWPNQSAAWADYDGDGWLDLFLPGYERPGASTPTGVRLFRNQTDGSFTDQTLRSNIGLVPAQIARTATWADYDQDGWLDLYVGAYRLQRNHLFRNLGGFFEELGDETGTAGIETDGSFGHTIGAEWGDLDNDGDLDLVVMNLAHPRFYHFSDKSKIYLNPLSEGGTEFVDVREAVGLWVVETASEPALGDFDNDGDLDLFQTNVYEGRESNLWANRLVEEGSLRFEEVSYSTGARVDNGWGAVWADVDADGDLDLLAQGLYRNESASLGHWLKVRLQGGAGQDTFGVGATVSVTAGDRVVTRLVSAGKGVGNQNPFELHFGLGQAAGYDSIQVRWPGGQVDTHPCGPADRSLVLVSGRLLEPGAQCRDDPGDDPGPNGCGCATRTGSGHGPAIAGLLALLGRRRRRRSG